MSYFTEKLELLSNILWAIVGQKLRKLVIKKFKQKKVYARFKDKIWAVDLAEMGSFSSKSRGAKYLLCVSDVFIKYVLNGVIEKVNKSKLWLDQRREFLQ